MISTYNKTDFNAHTTPKKNCPQVIRTNMLFQIFHNSSSFVSASLHLITFQLCTHFQTILTHVIASRRNNSIWHHWHNFRSPHPSSVTVPSLSHNLRFIGSSNSALSRQIIMIILREQPAKLSINNTPFISDVCKILSPHFCCQAPPKCAYSYGGIVCVYTTFTASMWKIVSRCVRPDAFV